MALKKTPEAFEKRLAALEKEISECKNELQSLGEMGKRTALLARSISIPILVIDENHRITHYNRAFEKLTGIPARELIGTRDLWKIFYKKPRPVMLDFIVDRVPEPDILKHFGKGCHKSSMMEGSYESVIFFPELGEKGKWFFFTAAPIVDEEGKILGAVETAQDVTLRKGLEERLRDSARRFRPLMEFLPYPVAVYNMQDTASYINPAFTRVFGWQLEELQEKDNPFVPPEIKEEAQANLKRLYAGEVLQRLESKRLTKDGQILDVVIKATAYSETETEPSGVVAIFRDTTLEKKIANSREALLHISIALPGYTVLEDLFAFINEEVKKHLSVEGSVVILLDEKKQELYVLGASYDAADTERRVKEIRFSLDQLIAGRVIKSGEPVIINDTSQERHIHEERDKRLGYKTRNLAVVPLRSHDRIIGVICAINKKRGSFDRSDIELLEMIAGTVALSIENARVSDELKKAYSEVSSMNRAKDKVINHLSHELKTPTAVLIGSLAILSKKLGSLPDESWKPTVEIARRNLERLKAIQSEAEDIMEDKQLTVYHLLSFLLEHCIDEIATLAVEKTGKTSLAEEMRRSIEELFGPKEAVSELIRLDQVVRERLEKLSASFSHREVKIVSSFETVPPTLIPGEVLCKVIDGLIRNAVENTPDEGEIEISVHRKGEGAGLQVRDYGVGIKEDHQKRIFEGFFTTKETMAYSTKKPFDFNAGGKGADLLRMKIFSERYNFQIEMNSTRCRCLPKETDICPGRISLCPFCKGREECHRSGGTTFSLYFPPANI